MRSDCFYLNYINYGEDWQNYINCEIGDYAVGGEVSMWGEYVDVTNLEPRLWPRASAAGQQLWNGGSYNISDIKIKAQLHHFRCFLISRGIPAQPIGPGGYCPFGEFDRFRLVDTTFEGDVEVTSETPITSSEITTNNAMVVKSEVHVIVLFLALFYLNRV